MTTQAIPAQAALAVEGAEGETEGYLALIWAAALSAVIVIFCISSPSGPPFWALLLLALVWPTLCGFSVARRRLRTLMQFPEASVHRALCMRAKRGIGFWQRWWVTPSRAALDSAGLDVKAMRRVSSRQTMDYVRMIPLCLSSVGLWLLMVGEAWSGGHPSGQADVALVAAMLFGTVVSWGLLLLGDLLWWTRVARRRIESAWHLSPLAIMAEHGYRWNRFLGWRAVGG